MHGNLKIRVHIFEGRQLPGNDINPMVRVTVAGQRKQTRTKQSTNNPIYNDEVGDEQIQLHKIVEIN